MKLALHGYGKMGRAVERVAKEAGHEVVAVIDDRTDSPGAADVLIDFSHADGLSRVLELAAHHHLSLVIGTTGWNERLNEVSARVREAGIAAVYSSNFSPGANIVFALARQAGGLLRNFPQYAAGMEERHHSQKKDAPSGTALRIAAEVRKGSEEKLDPAIVASRVGSEFGLHRLFFDSPDDVIEISHQARGRDGFARGAVVAAEMIAGKVGLHRFEDLVLPTAD